MADWRNRQLWISGSLGPGVSGATGSIFRRGWGTGYCAKEPHTFASSLACRSRYRGASVRVTLSHCTIHSLSCVFFRHATKRSRLYTIFSCTIPYIPPRCVFLLSLRYTNPFKFQYMSPDACVFPSYRRKTALTSDINANLYSGSGHRSGGQEGEGREGGGGINGLSAEIRTSKLPGTVLRGPTESWG